MKEFVLPEKANREQLSRLLTECVTSTSHTLTEDKVIFATDITTYDWEAIKTILKVC